MDDANELQVPTYLLRQMTSAEDEASEAFDLLVTCAGSCMSDRRLLFSFAISILK
jgi:hypothetical protein